MSDNRGLMRHIRPLPDSEAVAGEWLGASTLEPGSPAVPKVLGQNVHAFVLDACGWDIDYSWSIIDHIACVATDDQLAMLVSGPVEDFLSYWDERGEPMVEDLVGRMPRLREPLRGLRQLLMSDGVYTRVLLMAGTPRAHIVFVGSERERLRERARFLEHSESAAVLELRGLCLPQVESVAQEKFLYDSGDRRTSNVVYLQPHASDDDARLVWCQIWSRASTLERRRIVVCDTTRPERHWPCPADCDGKPIPSLAIVGRVVGWRQTT